MVLNQLCTPVPIDAPICFQLMVVTKPSMALISAFHLLANVAPMVAQSVFSKTLFSPAANPAPSVAQSNVLRKVLSVLNTRFKPSEISLPRFAQSKPDTRPFRIRAIRFAHSTASGCTVTIQSSTAGTMLFKPPATISPMPSQSPASKAVLREVKKFCTDSGSRLSIGTSSYRSPALLPPPPPPPELVEEALFSSSKP